jgi:hypothetical protein
LKSIEHRAAKPSKKPSSNKWSISEYIKRITYFPAEYSFLAGLYFAKYPFNSVGADEEELWYDPSGSLKVPASIAPMKTGQGTEVTSSQSPDVISDALNTAVSPAETGCLRSCGRSA